MDSSLKLQNLKKPSKNVHKRMEWDCVIFYFIVESNRNSNSQYINCNSQNIHWNIKNKKENITAYSIYRILV